MDEKKVKEILTSNTVFGNDDCILIFTYEFDKNICVHFQDTNSTEIFHSFMHNESSGFIYLYLTGKHYYPLIEVDGSQNVQI